MNQDVWFNNLLFEKHNPNMNWTALCKTYGKNQSRIN